MVEFKIKERRLQLGMKQSELVRKSGVSRTVVSELENGKEIDVRLSTIVALAKILKCSPTKLFKYTPDKVRSKILEKTA